MQWARFLGAAYVELFRNIPLLVQMFLWYFVVPEILPASLGAMIKQIPPPWGIFVTAEIGRAQVGTTVTNAHHVFRLLLEKKKKKIIHYTINITCKIYYHYNTR